MNLKKIDHSFIDEKNFNITLDHVCEKQEKIIAYCLFNKFNFVLDILTNEKNNYNVISCM